MKPISAVASAPNRVDLFGAGADNSAQHLWSLNSAWFRWESLGGVFTSSLVAVSRGPGLLDVFGLGTDFALYHRGWDGAAWSQWESLGGVFVSQPAAVATSPQAMDVVGLGSDHALYHRSWTNAGWSGAWELVGGRFVSTPAIVSSGDSRLDIFAVDTSFAMEHIARVEGAWSAWQTLGGIFSSEPTAIAWAATRPIVVEAVGGGGAAEAPIHVGPLPAETRITVFGLGTDRSLFSKTAVAGESFPTEWLPLGGAILGRVDAVSTGQDRVDVYGRGTDNAVYHRGFSGRWNTAWNSLGGVVSGSPTALFTGSRTELFAPGADFSVIHLSTGNLDGWQPLGGRVALPNTFIFSLDSFEIDETRSLHNDTDYVSATLTVVGHPPQTVTRKIGDVNNGTHALNIVFPEMEVDLSNFVLFTYLLLNTNNSDEAGVEKNLTTASNDIAIKGTQAAAHSVVVSTALGGALFGTAVLPVFGTIIGLIAGWLFGEFLNIAFVNCDGLVAAEQAAMLGVDLRRATMHGELVRKHTTHPGTKTDTGCGANSLYRTTWSFKRVDSA